MSSESVAQPTITPAGQVDQPEPAARENSPVVYGLGAFGLSSTTQALAGLPFYIVLFTLVYAVPVAYQQGDTLFWYALVVIFLFETVATVMGTNYQALFPELFQGFKIRTRASAYSQGLGSAGELVGFALTPIVYVAFGFAGMAVLFSVTAGVLLLISIFRNKEDPSAQSAPPLNLREAFGDVLRDRPFWHFTIVVTLLWFTTGIYTIGTAFYAKYTLGAGPLAPSLIFGTVFVIAIISVSVWSRLIRRWGVKKTWLWAIGVMILSAVALGLASDLPLAIIAATIAGAGLGGIKVCREMILARLVDRSLERTGRRQEGVYYGLNRFIGRLSKLLEALALILLGVFFGYVSGDDPGPNPESAFRFLMSVFPFICMVSAWLLARKLRLEKDEVLTQA